jgi:hypothetical protein
MAGVNNHQIHVNSRELNVKIREKSWLYNYISLLIEKRNEKNEIIEISPIKSVRIKIEKITIEKVSYKKQIKNSNSNDGSTSQFNVPSIITKQDTTQQQQQNNKKTTTTTTSIK